MDILEGLNAAQAAAVQKTSGPLLILAGAGSGKTKTVAHRIAYLIQNQQVYPEQILAVTFTNKAARELRERVWSLMKTSQSTSGSELQGVEASNRIHFGSKPEGQAPPRYFMPWMGTFHGICVRMLHQDGAHIGVDPKFVIFDEDDRQSVIKEAMKQLSIDTAQLKPRSVSAQISNAKNDLITPDEMEDNASYPRARDVAKIYRLYEKLRKEQKALDFDDLLKETVHLLSSKKDVCERWQRYFKHIFIDEYQDTNAAQYKIVQLLVNKDQNICVVGDDWQSIYSWRGADYRNILNFESDYPDALVVKLEQNYRSTQAILDAAQKVIEKNEIKADKKLFTENGQGNPVEVHPANDDMDEANRVADHVNAQVRIGARKYKDFAVLYRMNAQSAVLERSLRIARIPYQIVGGVRFYDRREIKDVLAYLRVVYQPSDRQSFSRIVNIPARGIGKVSLERFLTWQGATGMNVIEALRRVHEADGLTPKAKAALGSLGNHMSELADMAEREATPADIIERFLQLIPYRQSLRDGTPQAEEREENVGSLVSEVTHYESLAQFLEEAALMSSTDDEVSDDKVTLMTLHAAKGLEFPVVFMVGLEEGVFPHSRVYDEGPEQLEEERRLCYVGMTRAREELHMFYAYSRLQFGQRSYNPPSRFIDDMGGMPAEIHSDMPSEDNEYIDDYYDDDLVLELGDRVRTQAFGVGTVYGVKGREVIIRFDADKQKRHINPEFVRVEKI